LTLKEIPTETTVEPWENSFVIHFEKSYLLEYNGAYLKLLHQRQQAVVGVGLQDLSDSDTDSDEDDNISSEDDSISSEDEKDLPTRPRA